MDAYEAVVSRVEVREFSKNEVPFELQKKVLEAARQAPSAYNKQAWHFILINNKELLRKIGELAQTGRYISDSAFAVAVCIDPNYPQYIIDSARCIQGMMIAAWGLGLGSCWVGMLDRERISELLHIPKEFRIISVIPFGYPSKKIRGKKSRRQLKDVASINFYGENKGL
ncbi:MAG: nitroreductase family protein [Conexivisphaerales archaeon]